MRRDDAPGLVAPSTAAPEPLHDPEPGARWPARLQLQATRDGDATRVRHAHSGPLRLLKTLYPEGPGIAQAVLVHPPGGLVGGDRLDVDIDVAAGAHLLVTNPAATRFYRSVAGVAAQRLTARVGAGARLEWLPQETLAYDGCDALNTWQVSLDGSASLMAMEVLALGLGAADRPFTKGRFVQRLQIEGLWREHGVIDAHDAALLDGPCGLAGRRVLGTLVLAAGEPLPQEVAESALEAARGAAAAAVSGVSAGAFGGASDDTRNASSAEGPLLTGATLLHGRLLVLRVLAHEVEPAMRHLRRVRGLWRQRVWDVPALEPRIWAS